jgi:hypothetical protein
MSTHCSRYLMRRRSGQLISDLSKAVLGFQSCLSVQCYSLRAVYVHFSTCFLVCQGSKCIQFVPTEVLHQCGYESPIAARDDLYRKAKVSSSSSERRHMEKANKSPLAGI